MSVASARYGWIEASLRYAGTFGPREKSAYLKIFGVSESAMSRHQSDFARRLEEHLGRPVFRRNRRNAFESGRLTLLPGETLPESCLFPLPDLDRWLKDSLGPQFEQVAVIRRRRPDSPILRKIIIAIRSKRPVTIEYMSRSMEESARVISPHVLVDVVGRYHVRAFDHSKNRFADFVLARIKRCYPPADWRQAPFVGPETDEDWQDTGEILIEMTDPHSPEGVRVRVEWDLDQSGRRHVRARRALIPYLTDIREKGYESPVRVSAVKSDP